MSSLPPAVFGMWSVCSVLLGAFYIYHLWHYDRFRCLRVNQGPYSGAFKRVMAYTHLLVLPLLITYSVGNAVIKYQEGFIFSSQYGVIPKPYTEWTKAHQNATFPLLMLLSLCFSLEMITHLEEICFWLFLMNATASSQNWFGSIYFLTWSCGSVVALALVPTVSVMLRNDPLKDEAYTFLVGSCGSLTLTFFFVPTLCFFPAFLRKLATQGVDKATMIRLQKFYELNRLRLAFKLLFVVPLVIIGADGITPDGHPINMSMFWTEILGMSAAFGCVISAAITLLIFFPRNSESEYESSSLGSLARLEAPQRQVGKHYRQDALDSYHERNRLDFSSKTSIGSSPDPRAQVAYPISFASTPRAGDGYGPLPSYQTPRVRNIQPDQYGGGTVEVSTTLPSAVRGVILRPNRLCLDGNVELGGMQGPSGAGAWVKNWTSQFRSPLDIMQRLVC